jgi:hypothetical protein
MRRPEVTLDDTFLLTEGRVFIMAVPPGTQGSLQVSGSACRFSVQG